MTQTNHILSPKVYYDKLVEAFPELKVSLWDWDKGNSMIHYNMERFADFTILQIQLSNWSKLQECFVFQEQAIKSFGPELYNALSISYCEPLLLGEVSEKMNSIIKYMGPQLKKIYIEYKVYYSDLAKKKKEK